MSQAILSSEAIRILAAQWSITVSLSSKPGFFKAVNQASSQSWEIPQVLESEAALEFIGFRSDQAQEIYKDFKQQQQQQLDDNIGNQQQQDEKDPILLATAKKHLTTRFARFNSDHPLRLIPGLAGLNLEVGESLCSLIDIILADVRYQLNDVSKNDLFTWMKITVQRSFLSLKGLNAKILNSGLTPYLPPTSFPLSLKEGVSPDQTVGRTVMHAPNGFIVRANQAIPCWKDLPPAYPNLPPLEPGQQLVEILDPGIPSGFLEENGQRIPYWIEPPAPRVFILDEEREVIDELHGYDPEWPVSQQQRPRGIFEIP